MIWSGQTRLPTPGLHLSAYSASLTRRGCARR